MGKIASIATFDELDGFRVSKELGRVSVRVVRSRNRVRDAFASMRAFLGITALEIFTEAERARRESVAALQSDAQALGADAVIGVRFRIGKAKDGKTHVLALGRAVMLEPCP